MSSVPDSRAGHAGPGSLAVGMLKPGRITQVALWFEGALYRRAARVVTISDRFSSQLRDLGVRPGAISTILNWVHRFSSVAPSPSMRARLGARDDDFLVLHAGNMGQKQALEHVVDSYVSNEPGAYHARYMARKPPSSSQRRLDTCAASGLSHCFPPRRPHAIQRLMPPRLVSRQRPSHRQRPVAEDLFHMASNGRPIIAAVDRLSATADLVLAADVASWLRQRMPALAEGIEQLQRDPDMCRRMGNNGRRHATERFSKAKRAATSKRRSRLGTRRPSPRHE